MFYGDSYACHNFFSLKIICFFYSWDIKAYHKATSTPCRPHEPERQKLEFSSRKEVKNNGSMFWKMEIVYVCVQYSMCDFSFLIFKLCMQMVGDFYICCKTQSRPRWLHHWSDFRCAALFHGILLSPRSRWTEGWYFPQLLQCCGHMTMNCNLWSGSRDYCLFFLV